MRHVSRPGWPVIAAPKAGTNHAAFSTCPYYAYISMQTSTVSVVRQRTCAAKINTGYPIKAAFFMTSSHVCPLRCSKQFEPTFNQI